MQNKTAQNLVLIGIGLNIIQWVVVLLAFLKIKSLFGSYTITNPNVVNGSMQSFSFWQMLESMIYSGAPINIIAFTVIIVCIFYLVLSAIFIFLEIIAYFKIRQNNVAWSTFILAMGFKNILLDISGVPFLVAGLMMYRGNRTKQIGEE
ncbi:hypothetical protein [Metabacillus arenae]|uniref:DUF4064 domain-containing protein n=1 Tax=Metabacillus arenae TaxID=2771434 RepID=A0A926NK15_9BACI|nr:hypothetical protein [Metabacillus arenae]MBD1382495.1 hypothetical protein [Metabacillus arenae]